MKQTITLILLLVVFTAQAQTNTWTGTFGSDWNTNGNWSLGHVPTPAEDVVIVNPINGNYSAVINFGYNASVHNLTVNASPCGIFIYGGSLTASGTIINHGVIGIDNNNTGGLVQTATSTYSNTSTGFVEFVFYDANPDLGYRDVSFPLGGTINDIVVNTFGGFTPTGNDGVQCWYNYNPYPNVQVYDEALQIVDGAYNEGWLSYTGTSNPLSPMKGIAIRYTPSSNINYFFQDGVPNNGPQSTTITRTASPAHPTEEGWNLVGNPYPSCIDWPAVASLNPGITGSCYVFHSTGLFTGYWGAINSAGVFTGGLTSATLATAQGFFVRKSSVGSGPFVMDNSVRTNSPASSFKTEQLTNEIRLTLSDGHNTDEIVSYTDVTASSGYDSGLDAEKIPAGSTVYISFALQGNEYAINALDAITEQTELPLVLWAQNTGNYTINASALNITGLTAYLKDAQTNTLTDLSAGAVSVSLTGAQTYSGRYSIVFSANSVSGIKEQDLPVNIYASGNTVYINRIANTKAHVSITNLLGQQIAETPIATDKTALKLNSTDATMYVIVKLTEGSKVSVAKVLITN